MKKPICAATCLILASFLAQAADQSGADPHPTMERSNSSTSNSDNRYPSAGNSSTGNSSAGDSSAGNSSTGSSSAGNSSSGNPSAGGSSAGNSGTGNSSNNDPSTTELSNRKSNSENTNADNTDINERDRNKQALTPMDQSNSKADIKVTQAIRRSLMEKEMSTNAKNIKIITRNGHVTLRGPVASAEEKMEIAKLAKAVPGIKKVSNQLEVK